MTLQKHTETRTTHGGWTDVPVEIARRIPAYVEPLTGLALIRAAQIDPRASHRVTLRFRADVESGLELVYHDSRRGDRSFEIVGTPIDTEETHRELVVHCMEAAAAA